MSIRKASRELSRYVNAKVLALQSCYLSGLASSRATLARLRRLDTPGEASWMSIGEEIFAELPDIGMGESVERKWLESARAALQLYAVLQQSQASPVAVASDGRSAAGSFGSACQLLVAANNGDGAAGVKRRLAAIEAATDFPGTRHGVRALVRLMRSAKAPIQLDFGRLASDLFEIQFEDTRGEVFMRWARDFYRTPANNQTKGKPAKAE